MVVIQGPFWNLTLFRMAPTERTLPGSSSLDIEPDDLRAVVIAVEVMAQAEENGCNISKQIWKRLRVHNVTIETSEDTIKISFQIGRTNSGSEKIGKTLGTTDTQAFSIYSFFYGLEYFTDFNASRRTFELTLDIETFNFLIETAQDRLIQETLAEIEKIVEGTEIDVERIVISMKLTGDPGLTSSVLLRLTPEVGIKIVQLIGPVTFLIPDLRTKMLKLLEGPDYMEYPSGQASQ